MVYSARSIPHETSFSRFVKRAVTFLDNAPRLNAQPYQILRDRPETPREIFRKFRTHQEIGRKFPKEFSDWSEVSGPGIEGINNGRMSSL